MSDLKKLLAEATPGPWIRPWGATHVHAWGRDDVLDSQPNLDLIVHLRNHAEDYEALADAADALLTEWDTFGPTGTQDTLDTHKRLRAALSRLRDEVPA